MEASMSDVVERLRGYGKDDYSWRSKAEREAADEIELLRALLERCHDCLPDYYVSLVAEIKAALKGNQ
jgi:hypothetical protein